MRFKQRYIQVEMAGYEAAILACIVLGVGCVIGAIATINYFDVPWLGLPLGGAALAYIFSAYNRLVLWYTHRYWVIEFKQQTRDIFIFSEGESETHEDDTEMVQRLEFCLKMLDVVESEHRVTVWLLMFRDAVAIGHKHMGQSRKPSIVRHKREGITVRESRAEYRQFCAQFQAEKEQEKLQEKREQGVSDAWVNTQWFNQQTTQL